MRKRWVWIGVAATALILSVFAFWPHEPDEFEFLRQFDYVQQRSELIMSGATEFDSDGTTHRAGTGMWCTVLRFTSASPALLAELKSHCPYEWSKGDMSIELPNKRSAYFDYETASLFVYDEPPPSWFDLRVDQLRRALGLRSRLVFARDE
ncbi:MAG: hypothetical protein H7Y17_16365 [Chlorobia bacterium]|nr:hypothetical protein [Fimbriimonadaceae bacterium]